jgi:charged multivesicular body protein 7
MVLPPLTSAFRARLPALYSDFRPQRTLNPDGYQANVSAWRRALAKLVRSGLAPSLRGAAPSLLILNSNEQLLRALETKQYGRPLALSAVVQEALGAKDLIPLSQFLSAKDSIYQRPWSMWNLASWTMKQLGVSDYLRSDSLPSGQFVVVANVEDVGKLFREKSAAASVHQSRFERTFTKAHFYKTFNDQLVEGKQLSETDMDVLLKFLTRDKGVVLYDGTTVKIKAPGQEEAETEVTMEDASIASLKELLAYLTQETELLSTKVDEFSAKAKEAVVKKNRIAALAALKFKKQTELVLEKRYANMAQLQSVAANIEQASDNIQLVKVMESSEQALRSLNAEVGGVERVEKVVDRLREQTATVEEVQTIINEMGDVVVDDAEVDDELAAMEREEKRKVEEAEQKKQEAEKARIAALQEKEAEETRKRLEAAGEVPQGQEEKTLAKKTLQAENMLSELSLDEKAPEAEQPLPQAA